MEKVRFRHLTPEQINIISDGCGIVARGLRVPDFIFRARCDQHDFYTIRGTGWDWNQHWFYPYSIVRWFVQGQYWLQRAHWEFFYWMVCDAWSGPYQILESILYTFIAFIYWVVVVLWGLVVPPIRTLFLPRERQTMRGWRTIDECLEYAKLMQSNRV